jgi:hypothetical protein
VLGVRIGPPKEVRTGRGELGKKVLPGAAEKRGSLVWATYDYRIDRVAGKVGTRASVPRTEG